MALPILRFDVAALPCERIVQSRGRGIESLDHLRTAALPVLALQEHDKVIAANVSRKIALRVAGLSDDAGQQSDHFVALPIAESIVVRLEVIQIAVAGAEMRAAEQRSEE